MKGGRTFRYIASGAYTGKIATGHAVWENSIINLNGDKYRVSEDPTPTDEK